MLKTVLRRVFPFMGWLEDYGAKSFHADFISGLTVALVLIPQSMAYAQLAGLPPYYGLYAAFLPPMVGALFGSSRQLATGPVAVVSLMTAASLAPLATAGGEVYVGYAVLLALMVGVFQLTLGVLRLGLVVNFLSHPVVNGFTNAAAIIIASSQLSKMFGVSVDRHEHHYETIVEVVRAALHFTHWPTLALGMLAFAIMYGLKRIAPRVPNVLVAVGITTLLCWGVGLNRDAQVSLGAVESEEVRELANEFNVLLENRKFLSEERAGIFAEMESASAEGNELAVHIAEQRIETATLKINLLEERAKALRWRLRSFIFRGMEDADHGLRLVPRGELPAEEGGDGRDWRLKVGNEPLDLERLPAMSGVAVVGDIPKGLPSLSLPELDLRVLPQLFPYAAIISLLGFMEAISIAKAMAAKTGQRLDPNRELMGQGLANLFGSIAKSYPTSGSFSRSAVNLQSGAVSGFSSVISSLTVVIVLIFLTPLLYYLPQSVLAAVIMMAVIGLVNVSGFVHAWRAQWYDGAISVITFLSTLACAPHLDRGIFLGASLSLLVFLYKSMRPTVVSLSRGEDESLKDATVNKLWGCKYIDLVRFEGPLFFANASYLTDKINERICSNRSLKHIIIASNGINDIDASGEEALSFIVENTRSSNVDISLSGVNESVMAVLRRTYLLAKIGEDHIFATMEKAILAVHPTTHEDGDEEVCPLVTYRRSDSEVGN